MDVAGLLRHHHSVREGLARFVESSQAREQLAVLVVARNIRRMSLKKRLEIFHRGRFVALFHALQRQPVTGKRVARLLGDELFEHLAARLLCLGHRAKSAYYMRFAGGPQSAWGKFSRS